MSTWSSRKQKSNISCESWLRPSQQNDLFCKLFKWPKKYVSPPLPCSHSFCLVTDFIPVSGHLHKNWGYLSCLCVWLANSVLLTPWLRETFRSSPSQCAVYVITDLQSVAWAAFGASRSKIWWDAFLIWCRVLMSLGLRSWLSCHRRRHLQLIWDWTVILPRYQQNACVPLVNIIFNT